MKQVFRREITLAVAPAPAVTTRVVASSAAAVDHGSRVVPA